MKDKIKRTLIASLAMTLMTMPTLAYAEQDGADTSASSSTSTTVAPTDSTRAQQFRSQLEARLEQSRDAAKAKFSDAHGNLQARLSGAFKKACENHAATIDRLMTNMNNRRQNAFDRISQITTAVEDFYAKKGLTVDGYDALVTNVNVAKGVAQTAMSDQQAIPSLDCSGDHPRADVTDFRIKRSASIDAMKAYRDAVKNLVTAVKTAAHAATVSEDSHNAQ